MKIRGINNVYIIPPLIAADAAAILDKKYWLLYYVLLLCMYCTLRQAIGLHNTGLLCCPEAVQSSDVRQAKGRNNN